MVGELDPASYPGTWRNPQTALRSSIEMRLSWRPASEGGPLYLGIRERLALEASCSGGEAERARGPECEFREPVL